MPQKKMRAGGGQNRSDKSLDDLVRMFNPVMRGWMNYFAKFYKLAMYPTLRRLAVVCRNRIVCWNEVAPIKQWN